MLACNTSFCAFSRAVDLMQSSIRPGMDETWFAALQARVMRGVGEAKGSVNVHVGNWSHDLDQVCTERIRSQADFHCDTNTAACSHLVTSPAHHDVISSQVFFRSSHGRPLAHTPESHLLVNVLFSTASAYLEPSSARRDASRIASHRFGCCPRTA